MDFYRDEEILEESKSLEESKVESAEEDFEEVLPEKKRHKKKEKKQSKWRKWLKRFLVFMAACLLLGVLAIFIFTHSSFYKDMCNKAYDTLATMDEGTFRMYSNTQVFDKDGNVIGEIDTGNFEYEYEKISDIPLHLQNAYIAAEDRSFKEHHGFDIKGIIRAGVALIKNKGEITQGGSTITQQVIKNNMLTQEQTFVRKFLEILTAPEMEKRYSKQQIMEFYCNSNYYGNGCYGVGSASRFYFGKDVKELSLAECAMLAAISNSPNNYNPVVDAELAKEKMSLVLDQMFEQEMITEEELNAAKAQELAIAKSVNEVTDMNNYMCSYAIHSATLTLMEQDGFEFQYLFPDKETEAAYREAYEKAYNSSSSTLYEGGYKIYTSFDQKLQQTLQESVDNSLSNNQIMQENGKFNLQAAGVVVDNETGYIVAMVGGRGANDQFNRGFLAKRQPGSTIKPILDYGPAFDKGLATPSSIYTDEKTTAANGFAPNNADRAFHGNMNLRTALARSTNTIALQLFEQVGQADAMKYLEQMKFGSLSYADNSAVSICLGGFTNGLTVADMAKAYAAIEDNGKYNEKTCIIKIEHEDKGLLYEGDKEEKKQVYSQDTAYMLTDMMQGVFTESYGTAYGTDIGGHIAAGKTGTTNEDRDSWLCGFTPYYTTAVWVGYDDNSPLQDTSYSQNIWKRFMTGAHQGKSVKDFSMPDNMEFRNVLGDGTLGEKIYNKEMLDKSKRMYLQRPEGFDLYSKKVTADANKYQKKLKLQKEVEAAESAVKAFEGYKIDSIDSAKGLGDAYNTALEVVEKVSSIEKQSAFKTRLADKMEKLEKTKKKWDKKIEEAEAAEEKKQKAEQSAIDEQNATDATENLKQTRISNMRQYLDLLSVRQYNTDAAQVLISDAQGCLSNLKEYDEYESLKKELESQIQRINGLPTEVPQPEIPENENDIPPESSDYPIEEVPEEYVEETEEYVE